MFSKTNPPLQGSSELGCRDKCNIWRGCPQYPYNKLLTALCIQAADIDLASIKGMQNKPILKEAEEVQAIRNKVVHQGYRVTEEELGKAKNIAYLMLTEVVEPILNNLELVISSNKEGHCVAKA